MSERFAGIVTRSLRREFSTKDGPARVAVNDLNLRIEPGDLVAMLGPNGAGKTTTVRMLTGLLRPTSGSAMINGYDVAREHRQAAHGCGWSLGGELGLYPRLTATQNLTFFGLMYGMRGRALRNRVAALLHEVDLTDRAREPVSTFSRGMKQRLHLARAILHDPPVLILDEPSAGLDPQSAAAMRTLVRRFADEGRTVLLTTHDMREAEELSERVVLIRDGAVQAEETAAQLRLRAAGQLGYRVEVVWQSADEPVPDCSDCPALLAEESVGGASRLRVRDGGAAAQWVLANFGARVASVSVTLPTLEEVFLDLVGNR